MDKINLHIFFCLHFQIEYNSVCSNSISLRPYDFYVSFRKHFRSLIKYFLISFACIVQINCIEVFEPATLAFEDILVVEATITDELKKQEVFLSRTTMLENRNSLPETGAQISISDNISSTFTFEEISPGKYSSSLPFNAELGKEYSMSIRTSDGQSYISESVSMAGKAQIDHVSTIRKINDNGTDGVEISIEGSGIEGDASFFRYEYEETYKIASPYLFDFDLIIASESPARLDTIVKTKQERFCFNTRKSNDILTFNSNTLKDDKVENFPVQFVGISDPILITRYSILVKQFVHTREAYSFYETLSEISDLESLFTQLQPGFLEGNISSIENPDKNVLGIFEIASVREERIFFNFNEIFINEDRPGYFVSCGKPDLLLISPSPTDTELFRIKRLLDGGYKLVSIEQGLTGEITAYVIAPPACVDCSSLGTNTEPDFWVE